MDEESNKMFEIEENNNQFKTHPYSLCSFDDHTKFSNLILK